MCGNPPLPSSAITGILLEMSATSARAGETAAADQPAPAPVRVVIAEDAYVIREFLTSALGSAPGIELAAICTDGRELRAAIERWLPEVIVTDIRMPPSHGDEGIEIAQELRDSHPEIGVVVLSQYADPAYVLALFEYGTGGRAYLLKERVRNQAELLGAIETVASGGSVIDPTVIDLLIQARAKVAHSRLAQLTPRERELLAEIASGKSNGAIARTLFLTKRAVEKHVNSIFSKLDLPATDEVSRRVKATLIYLAEEGVEPTP